MTGCARSPTKVVAFFLTSTRVDRGGWPINLYQSALSGGWCASHHQYLRQAIR